MTAQPIDPAIMYVAEMFFARPQMYVNSAEDSEENRENLIKLALNYMAVWNAIKNFGYDPDEKYASSPDETPDRPGRVYKLNNEENEWIQEESARLHDEYLPKEFWKSLPLGMADQ